MNYKKIVLVGFISAFVAILTSVLGVAGTVIGSVISSVLYNTLSEVLEKPVTNTSFKRSNFEWDIAYAFPLIVIAIIQLMLIFALLAEHGVMPVNFLSLYLSLQNLANNNLYRILGLALLIMSAYPFVLKPENVNKIQGGVIAFVGLVFLARGLVDLGNSVTDIYDGAFIHFDFEIAIFALILLTVVIVRILLSAKQSKSESNYIQKDEKTFNHKVYYQKPDTFDIEEEYGYDRRNKPNNSNNKRTSHSEGSVNRKNSNKRPQKHSHKFKSKLDDGVVNQKSGINESHDNIHFESNDLLDEYKK